MSSPFSSLPTPKPDPIFAVTAEAIKAGPSAINGTIGVYMDEAGITAMFPSVKQALKDAGRDLESQSYAYPPLLGVPEYRRAAEKLITGDLGLELASLATTGGTGALAINLRLLKMLTGTDDLFLQTPAWANHMPVALDAGCNIHQVPYLLSGKASIQPLLDAIKKHTKPFGVLLQVSCHNPTGLDLEADDWKALAQKLATLPCTALLDFAYQGFKSEPEVDAKMVHVFTTAGVPTLITWSAAKNHSIYGLRAGLACAVLPDKKLQATVEGTYSTLTRRLHSAASTFGQRVVAITQEHYGKEWRADLKAARQVMETKRSLLKANLPASFHASLAGYGMFAMLPLSPEQVTTLKTDHQVFLTLDGRINIAGIPERRIEELCEKILAAIG